MADFHTKMQSEAFYAGLDEGIRFPVRVLHAHGIETGQSCEGKNGKHPAGAHGEGHSYDHPTIDLWGQPVELATAFHAMTVLTTYGLEPDSVALRWRVINGLPVEPLWRVTLAKVFPERADEQPTFVYGSTAESGLFAGTATPTGVLVPHELTGADLHDEGPTT